MKYLKVALIAGLVLTVGLLAFSKVTITWWHAMSGSRLPVVEQIVKDFNAAHPDIEVKAVYTGRYAETLTKFIAAYRAGNPPNLVQVYEVGTETMIDSGAIIPVYKLPEMFGENWDWGKYIIPITNYYSVNGKLWSMPFNSSTAMLYYNKDLFAKAGLDPNNPPTTWAELEEVGKKLLASGVVKNVLSFGWPGWIFEQMFAYHNQLYANNGNGREGLATEVLINGDFGVKVLGTWARLAREGIFLYGGPEYSANQAFISGQIAMLIQSTSSLAGIEKASNFQVGTAFLPRFAGYPLGNSVIGGASLWVAKGQSEEELKAVWEFLKWIGRTETAIMWHKGTGYFPATNEAVKKLLDEGWFSKDQNYLTAFLQILSGRRDTPAAQGVRMGPFVQIREIERAAIEKAVSDAIANPKADVYDLAKKALDEAAKKANELLQEYASMHG